MARIIKTPVNQLAVGLFVDLQLSWSEHPFTFSKLKIKDQKTLETIQSLPIDHVLVNLDKSDVAIPEPEDTESAEPEDSAALTEPEKTAPASTQEALSSVEMLRQHRAEVEGNYRKTSEKIQQMTANMKDRPANVVRDIDQIILQMSSIFNDSNDMISQMVNLGNGDFSDANHIANVTMLSLMIGKAEDMTTAELTLLGTAALLHDVGKIKVPLAIRNKVSALSDAEEKIYQQHTYAGRQLVEQIKTMHPEVLNAIEQHHEYIDGSGYPKGLKGDKLSKIVRIICITNLYDNLCNPQNVESALTPKNALATLYRQYRNKLDQRLLERLIGLLGVYPPGTVVRLSDGSIALVISGDSNAHMNPNVLIYDENVRKSEAKMISLADYPDLSIVEALKPGEYSQSIHNYLGLSERIGYMIESDQKHI